MKIKTKISKIEKETLELLFTNSKKMAVIRISNKGSSFIVVGKIYGCSTSREYGFEMAKKKGYVFIGAV